MKVVAFLEIFLDRLVWAASTQGDLASEYVLDERYQSGLSKRDAALRDLLTEMSLKASAAAKSSTGWNRVAACLRYLRSRRRANAVMPGAAMVDTNALLT